jgi:hypothetical protein
MGGHFGALGGRAGAFGFLPRTSGFSRRFVSTRFDPGFRRRFGDGRLLLPRLGPIALGGGFFNGFVVFPLVDGFLFFNRFQFIDQFPFIPGFPNRGFGFFDFGPRAFPLGFFPSFGGWGWGGAAPAYSGGPYSSDTLASGYVQQAEARPALGRQLAVPVTGSAGDSLVVERVTVMDVVPAAALRLTWRNARLPAEQVALFLADTARAILAAQTIRAPPFTALLEPAPATAFAGVTVVWQDGTTSTRMVPYRFVGR